MLFTEGRFKEVTVCYYSDSWVVVVNGDIPIGVFFSGV